jgi:predicted CoA-binding protein
MSGEACPLPSEPGMDERAIIQRLLKLSRIAVVGLSDDPSRPSYYVSMYMRDQAGKQIVPVNPSHDTVWGQKCYASLDEIPEPIDLVNVFRRPNACPDVVRAAIRKGVKGIWLQAGIISDEARTLARDAGIDYVEDRCIMVEHRMHR